VHIEHELGVAECDHAEIHHTVVLEATDFLEPA
jgi:hypothetical protein